MKNNPVYKREMLVRSRSFRIPLIIMIFNGILAVVALLNMYQSIAQVKVSGSVRYENFLQLYAFVAALEFMLLMFIMPALTSASISGERERQTLDLMLTTRMSAGQIVGGKLLSALSTLLLLILSSFPAVAMVFVYGGITWADAFSLILCYVTVAFFAGSIGICFSAALKRSTISTVVTYGTLVAVVAGTYFINRFALSISGMSLDKTTAYSIADSGFRASSGVSFYLFLFNPAVTFMAIIGEQAGRGTPLADIVSYFGMSGSGIIIKHWIGLSIVLQLTAGAALIAGAIHFVEPVKHKKSRLKRVNKKVQLINVNRKWKKIFLKKG